MVSGERINHTPSNCDLVKLGTILTIASVNIHLHNADKLAEASGKVDDVLVEAVKRKVAAKALEPGNKDDLAIMKQRGLLVAIRLPAARILGLSNVLDGPAGVNHLYVSECRGRVAGVVEVQQYNHVICLGGR